MQFKVMEYNVLNGFHRDETRGEEKVRIFTPSRLHAAKKAVEGEKPDILVLTESCFSQEKPNEGGQIINYQKEFGFPYGLQANYGSNRGLSVLSRFPVSGKSYASRFNGFMRTKLKIREGTYIHLDVAHPHPQLSEGDKSRFFESILRDADIPYILAGDFNSLSNQDRYDFEKLREGFATFDPNAPRTVNGLSQRLSIPVIRKTGLMDTFIEAGNKFDFTIPTDLLSADKRSGMRIDYIFCSRDFKVQGASIVKNEFTNQASDHYPITAVLEF